MQPKSNLFIEQSKPDVPMPRGLYPLWRFGRQLFWPRPLLYNLVGRWSQANCLDTDFDIWVDGFPRSANSFCAEAFHLIDPSLRIRTHKHLPPPIIQAVASGKPGVLVIRQPEAAIVSWALYCGSPLEPALDYYLDFHAAMRRYIPQLFVAPFETITNDFASLIHAFNARFRTSYQPVHNDEQRTAKCFSVIECVWRDPHGEVDELKVARPSAWRAQLAPALRNLLTSEARFQNKLNQAREFYFEFLDSTARDLSWSMPRTIRVNPYWSVAPGESARKWQPLALPLPNPCSGLRQTAARFLPLAWRTTLVKAWAWFATGMPRKGEPRTSMWKEFSTHWVTLLAGLGILAAVSAVDFLTGPEVTMWPFYLIPCALLALVVGPRWGTLAAFMCAISATLFSDPGPRSGHESPFLVLWNLAMRFLVFEVPVLLLARMRSEIETHDASGPGNAQAIVT
jgi:hypothetical protein